MRETRLSERLALGPDVAVAVRGDLAIPELVEALDGLDRALPWDADVVVAVVQNAGQLGGLSAWLVECEVTAPTWVVHRTSLHGDADGLPEPIQLAVRDALRDAGFTVVRSCSVADGWRALRAVPPRFA